MDWIAEQYGFKVYSFYLLIFFLWLFLFFIYIQFNLFVLICLSSIVNLTSTRNKNVFFWKKGSDYQLFSALYFLYQYTVVLSLSTYICLVGMWLYFNIFKIFNFISATSRVDQTQGTSQNVFGLHKQQYLNRLRPKS